VHGPITGEQNQEATMAVPQGVISASLIVMIVAAAIVGAGVGGMIGPNIEPAVLAVICGFVATLCAVLLRNQLLHRLSGAGPDSAKIPIVVAVFAMIASLAGSLGAKELLDRTMGDYSMVWLGTLAGLFSAILMSLLLITYLMPPEKPA
jgi:hypothetical protein